MRALLLLLLATNAFAVDPYRSEPTRSLADGADERVQSKLVGHGTSATIAALAQFQAIIDSSGRLYTKADIVSSALPSGAATSAKQDEQTALLTSIYADMATAAKQDTGNASLASIKTAVELIDDIVDTNKARVSVVDALPAGTNNIGDVDVVSQVLTTNRTASGIIDANGETVETEVTGTGTTSMQLVGTYSGTLQFEVTVDGTNWISMRGWRQSTGSGASSTSNIQDIFAFSSGGYFKLRARASAWTSGSVTVSFTGSSGTNAVQVVNQPVINVNDISDPASLVDAFTNPSTGSLAALNFVFNGTTWDRARGDITNGLDVDVTRTSLDLAEDAAHNSGDKGVQALTVRSDTPTAKAGTDGDYQPLITDLINRLFVRAVTDRPSSGASRTNKHGYLVHGSGSRVFTNGTVTEGKTLYVTDIHIPAYNTSTSAPGDVRIRDGASGAEKQPISIQQAGLAAGLSTVAIASAAFHYDEPLQFTTSVAVDVVTGTVTYSASFVGYEE